MRGDFDSTMDSLSEQALHVHGVALRQQQLSEVSGTCESYFSKDALPPHPLLERPLGIWQLSTGGSTLTSIPSTVDFASVHDVLELNVRFPGRD